MKRRTSGVVLTAGFAGARHVYILAELLRRSGLEVAGLLVVSPFSLRRIRAYLRRYGASHLFRNHLPRLLGRAPEADTGVEDAPLARLAREHGIEPGSLKAWASENDVSYQSVSSINSEVAVRFVASRSPEWVVYGGGGILRKAFIKAADGRILNAHSGPLPQVRGMNAAEWSLLLGYEPTVTIHLIDEGIDTGGVITTRRVPVYPGDTISRVRERCVVTGIRALHEVVMNPPADLPAPLSEATAHRQCFVLAPALRELLRSRLKQQSHLKHAASTQSETSQV